MVVKLKLVVDSSDTYLDSIVRDTAKNWGFTTDQINHSESWLVGMATQSGLFSSPEIVHLNLRDATKLKQFNDYVKKNPTYFNDDWFGLGVIISVKDARSVKTAEKLVSDSGGEIIKKRKPKEIISEMMSSVKIKPQIKKELTEYAGDDYDLLVGLVKNLKTLSDEEQKKLTTEEVFLKIPMSPGEVPPWEFINPLFEGNITTSLDKLDRSMKRSSPLKALSLLKREVDKLYKYVILNSVNISDQNKLSPLGLTNSYGLISIKKIKNFPSIQTAEYLVHLVYNAESDYKTGNVYNDEIYMRNLVMNICLSLRYNKPLERV